MVDSSDAALVGAVAGGAAGWRLTDNDWRVAVLGAGAGLVVAGEAADRTVEN